MTLRLPADLNTMARQLTTGLSAQTLATSVRCSHGSVWRCHAMLPTESPPPIRAGERIPAMSPELSYGRHAGPARWDARMAAVQVLLFLDQGVWYLPLTLRPSHLQRHAGQVSFAGGVIEPGETPRDCAWREWCEELGEPVTAFQWVGELPSTFVFASNFLVTPYVALASGRPHYQLNPDEVAEVLELPLESVLRGEFIGEHLEQRGPLRFRAPHFLYGGHRIWGATALILEMLGAVIQQAIEADKSVPQGTDRFGKQGGGDIFRQN